MPSLNEIRPKSVLPLDSQPVVGQPPHAAADLLCYIYTCMFFRVLNVLWQSCEREFVHVGVRKNEKETVEYRATDVHLAWPTGWFEVSHSDTIFQGVSIFYSDVC